METEENSLKHLIALPHRPDKPRTRGMTVAIDNGAPTRWFTDIIDSHHRHVDLIKFGWGTSLVSDNLLDKIRVLKSHGIGYFFGGTLFEVAFHQNRVEAFRRYCLDYECAFVEISNGTVPMDSHQKSRFIREFARDFRVLSEVGYKDNERSLRLHPARWIEYLQEDLAAGAYKVVTEARESGTGGICRADGEVRYGLIEEILGAPLAEDSLVFEAPTKDLQTYFIRRVGPNVHLANIALHDVISLETLRMGLRADTFGAVSEPGRAQDFE